MGSLRCLRPTPWYATPHIRTRWAYAVAPSCVLPIGTPAIAASARRSAGTGSWTAGCSCLGSSPMIDSTLNHSAVARRQSFWWSARAGRRERRSHLYIWIPRLFLSWTRSLPGQKQRTSRAREGFGRNRYFNQSKDPYRFLDFSLITSPSTANLPHP